VKLTLIVFSDESKIVWRYINAKACPKLTTKEYNPCGSTALTDAVGIAIENMQRHVAQIPLNERPGKVSFFITTDGEENSSRRFSRQQVKEMITRQTEEEKWEFLFAGANIDAFAVGQQYGIQRNRIANIQNDGQGQRELYCAIAHMACCSANSSFQSVINR